MHFCVLSSGSKANCVFVQSENTKLLIDCGLSARETCKRLRSIGVEPEEINAVVVTHEHRDHVCGIPVFVRNYPAVVYATSGTFRASALLEQVPSERRRWFHAGEEFRLGDMCLEPFSIQHDAADPVMFRISSFDYALAVVTDLGQVTSLVRERTRNIDAIVLESNHDPILLRECPYPWELKQRISGRSGHLSNETAGELLAHLSQDMQRGLRFIVAAHISENANDPLLALEVLKASWRGGPDFVPEFVAANPYVPTRLFCLAEKSVRAPDGGVAVIETQERTLEINF